jgi:NTE family protein
LTAGRSIAPAFPHSTNRAVGVTKTDVWAITVHNGGSERHVTTSISPLRRRSPETLRTAFVLSGGGNQAVCQVGMLRALIEHGIVPDVLIGTSAGACNAAVIAAHPNLDGVHRLVATWEALRGEDVFPGGRLARAWNLLTRDDHLFENTGLRALMMRGDTPELFEELAVPLRVIACDLDTGQEVVFAAGPIEPALLASAALPGLFPPIHHDGRVLVDGAVVNTVPLSHALVGPVDRVYVLSIAGELLNRSLRSPIDVAIRAFAISRKQRFELELRTVPDGVDVVVLPAPHDDREVNDFSEPLEYIDAAYVLADQALADADAARRRRNNIRRPWWRRRAG